MSSILIVIFSIISRLSKEKIEVIKTWHGNKNKSILLAIPTAMSKKYHLDEPSFVILEPKQDGIFLRKFKGETE